MKTAVLQTYRTRDVPAWMARAMASVRAWAEQKGYEYHFRGDEIFDLCGGDYLRAVGDNKCSITNLARLEWMRESWLAGYERVIWLDADTFVFDPKRFDLGLESGYAAGRAVWIDLGYGRPATTYDVHNAALVSVGPQPDIERMIELIRYIAATRTLESNLQVGVNLLTGLHSGFRFPLLVSVAMLSTDLVEALASTRHALLRLLAKRSGYPIHAANMGGQSQKRRIDEAVILRAMDWLETTEGEIVNRFLGPRREEPLLIADYKPLPRTLDPLDWWWQQLREEGKESVKHRANALAAKLGMRK